MTERNIYKNILFGVAVGDALGVPVEFKSRQTIAQKPVADMIGYGTYNLPAGTFSDDSSLAFCLAEALTQEFNLQKLETTLFRGLTIIIGHQEEMFLMLALQQAKLSDDYKVVAILN